MSTPVELIKDRLPILDIAKGYFKVEKAGRNYKARCPFHSEKTPSFFISPERNTYYCFGCGAKGDIFSLVERFEGLDFRGALVELAKRADVPLQGYSGGTQKDSEEKDSLYRIHEDATQYFILMRVAATEINTYLQARGLSQQTIDTFRIGYARDEWRGLYDHLKAKGYDDREIEDAGLAKKADQRIYDRFRGRIVFPLSDSSGRVIAFSGRIFEQQHAKPALGSLEAPKYLNSPETSIFRKSSTLYGLDRAKSLIRKSDFSIIVEGQMDLVMMHQIGFSNTVATSGTSLTEEHLRILKRFSDNVLLAMDGDDAGFHSALRGAELGLMLGLNVKLAVFPPGKDPADVAGTNPAAVKEIIRTSQHVIDVLLEHIQKRGYDERKYRLVVQKEVFPFVHRITNRIDQEHYIQKIAHRLNLPEDSVREEIRKIGKSVVSDVKEVGREDNPSSIAVSVGEQVRNRLVGLLLVEEGRTEPRIDTVHIRSVLEKYGPVPHADRLQEEQEVILYETERLYEEEGMMREEATELVKVLEQAYIKATYQEKLRELRDAEAVRDQAGVDRLLKECLELSKELEKLKAV